MAAAGATPGASRNTIALTAAAMPSGSPAVRTVKVTNESVMWGCPTYICIVGGAASLVVAHVTDDADDEVPLAFDPGHPPTLADGICPGQICCAAVSPTTMTRGASARSASVRRRPRFSGMRITLK